MFIYFFHFYRSPRSARSRGELMRTKQDFGEARASETGVGVLRSFLEKKKKPALRVECEFFSLLSKDLSQSTAENEIFHLSFDSASTHSLLLACFTLLTVHIESMNNQYLR